MCFSYDLLQPAEKVNVMSVIDSGVLLACPVCDSKSLAFREVRSTMMFYRQRLGGPPKGGDFRVVFDSGEGCLYEYDSRDSFMEELQAQCQSCGLKWVITDCKRIEDLKSLQPEPAPAAETIRRIKASDVVRDIEGRLSDPDLMSKYQLTGRQLEVLLQQLVDTGKVTQKQIDRRLNMAETAITRAFDETRRSVQELEDDFDYTEPEPEPLQPAPTPTPAPSAPPPAPAKSGSLTINVRRFTADVLAGVPDDGLMSKYSLDSKQLQFVFQRIVDLGVVTTRQLYERTSRAGTDITKEFVEVYQAVKELSD